MNNERMEFECMACSKMFSGSLFAITRNYERVDFNDSCGMPVVHPGCGDCIGAFCSRSCHEAGRAGIMKDEGVPVPAVLPDFLAIETCAKCAGPVDMADWHLSYTESVEDDQGWTMQVLESTYLAVVCKTCAPREGHRTADVVREADAQQTTQTPLEKWAAGVETD